MNVAASDPPQLALSRVPRSKLAEQVAEQIMERIREQGVEPGTRLPSERELMSALKVGRSSVREAINGLAMLGVVEIRHGQGVFVADRSRIQGQGAIIAALAKGVTRELFEARRVVEPEAARLAAERRTDAELEEMRQTLDRHAERIAAGELAVEESVAFHLRIAEAAHNELLAGFVSSFSELLAERGPILEELPGFQEWELQQHTSVFEPVRDADPELAAERMLAHLDAVVGYHERIGLE